MNKQTTTVGVLGVLVIGIAILFFGFSGDETLSATHQSYVVSNVVTATGTTNKAQQYTATITYQVPAPEQNSLTLNVTVSDGIITAADVQNVANSSQSEEYGSRFMNAYKTAVVGKKLSDISLSRIGGASLTSNAFNAALTAIKTKVS